MSANELVGQKNVHKVEIEFTEFAAHNDTRKTHKTLTLASLMHRLMTSGLRSCVKSIFTATGRLR